MRTQNGPVKGFVIRIKSQVCVFGQVVTEDGLPLDKQTVSLTNT